MLQAISTALCQWITAVFLMAPCGPMCIVPDGNSQESYWAPLAISWAEHVASHTHSQCWLQELFASDQQRGEKHAIKLAVGSKSFGWLLQIAFSESLDPPWSYFFRMFGLFFAFFGQFLVPVLGPKRGPKNGPRNRASIGFLIRQPT